MALPISPPYPPMASAVLSGCGNPKARVAEYKKRVSDSSPEIIHRRLPIGAEVLGDGEVHFRVWAPRSQRVEVIIGGGAARKPSLS